MSPGLIIHSNKIEQEQKSNKVLFLRETGHYAVSTPFLGFFLIFPNLLVMSRLATLQLTRMQCGYAR